MHTSLCEVFFNRLLHHFVVVSSLLGSQHFHLANEIDAESLAAGFAFNHRLCACALSLKCAFWHCCLCVFSGFLSLAGEVRLHHNCIRIWFWLLCGHGATTSSQAFLYSAQASWALRSLIS